MGAESAERLLLSQTAILTALRADARLMAAPGAPARLALGPATLTLGTIAPGALSALHGLAQGNADIDALADAVGERDGEQAVLGFRMLVSRLDSAGLLSHTLWERDRLERGPLATLEPYGLRRSTPGRELLAGDEVALSRFAAARRDGERTVIETPLSLLRVVVHDARVAGLLALLGGPPTSAPELAGAAQRTIGLAEPLTLAVLSLFGRAGLLAMREEGEPGPAEDHARQLVQWHPTDLEFHERTRLGSRLHPYGGTYRLAERFAPLPAEPAPQPLDVRFAAVDLQAVAAREQPLCTVMERRRSVREHDDDAPITVAQVGELLYRTVRTRGVFDDGHEQALDRPLPGAGSLHPLSVYAAVRRCDGLDPGLYRYQSDGHGLVAISADSAGVTQLLGAVPLNPGSPSLPQVLLVISARFGRAMWKYEAIPYALILKDLGVLYQSLYLVATAMDLAPCALGGGDAAAFNRLTGLDPCEESSVGEFAIGSLPGSDPIRADP